MADFSLSRDPAQQLCERAAILRLYTLLEALGFDDEDRRGDLDDFEIAERADETMHASQRLAELVAAKLMEMSAVIERMPRAHRVPEGLYGPRSAEESLLWALRVRYEIEDRWEGGEWADRWITACLPEGAEILGIRVEQLRQHDAMFN